MCEEERHGCDPWGQPRPPRPNFPYDISKQHEREALPGPKSPHPTHLAPEGLHGLHPMNMRGEGRKAGKLRRPAERHPGDDGRLHTLRRTHLRHVDASRRWFGRQRYRKEGFRRPTRSSSHGGTVTAGPSDSGNLDRKDGADIFLSTVPACVPYTLLLPELVATAPKLLH